MDQRNMVPVEMINNGNADGNDMEPVQMINNVNVDGDNMYQSSMVPVGILNNINPDVANMYQPNMVPVDATTDANGNNMYQPNMVPVDATTDENEYQLAMVPVNMLNTSNGGNNMYPLNMVPVDVPNNVDGVNNHATGDNNYYINNATGVNNYNTNVNGENNIINDALALGDEAEFGSENTSENRDVGSGSEQERRPAKKKRYHRHSQHQIQEMEAFFKECPHPDDKQRKELSRQLGISHLQIKFWFQNKRTQNKNHQERHENAHLRSENDKLRADNYRYREAVFNAKCPTCLMNPTAIGEMSFEEHHLRIENARLKEEIRVLTGGANNPVMTSAPIPPPQPLEAEMVAAGGNGGNNTTPPINGQTDADNPMIIELAVGAMDELMRMVQVGEPLWMPAGFDGTSLVLNLDEYARLIQKVPGPRLNGFRTEGSRQTAIVFMNHMDIVATLMSVDKWSSMFAGLVATAAPHGVISAGVPGNGEIQLMSAEFTVPSPLVPTRESYFARYYKQHGEGLWAVVDVSLDQIVPNMCWRRPSGCLIQQLPNGYSKVTWIEHVEVENTKEVHYLYRHFLNTGQALSATRWVLTLDRQCERKASITALAFPSLEPGGRMMMSDEAKTRVLRLGDRMTRSLYTGVTSSTAHKWFLFNGGLGDDLRVMTSKSEGDPGRPSGTVLCATASFWLPASPQTIFDFLRDESTRPLWDVLSTGTPVQKMSEISNGRDLRNGVTLLMSTNFNQDKMVIVQESSTDPTFSYVVYAPVDGNAIENVVNGGNPDHVALLPSGFVILPDGAGLPGGEGGGSLLTISFQMLVDSAPSGNLSMGCVATVDNLIRSTMQKTKALFPCPIEKLS